MYEIINYWETRERKGEREFSVESKKEETEIFVTLCNPSSC